MEPNIAAASEIWTTKEIVASIIATGVVSGLATNIISRWDAYRSAKKDATAIAVILAAELEAYAVRCWEKVLMDDADFAVTREPPRGLNVPRPPALLGDWDRKLIDPILLDTILSLSNTIAISSGYAAHASTFEGNPFDVTDATRNSGREAWAVATRLRARYGLRAQDEMREQMRDLFR